MPACRYLGAEKYFYISHTALKKNFSAEEKRPVAVLLKQLPKQLDNGQHIGIFLLIPEWLEVEST